MGRPKPAQSEPLGPRYNPLALRRPGTKYIHLWSVDT